MTEEEAKSLCLLASVIRKHAQELVPPAAFEVGFCAAELERWIEQHPAVPSVPIEALNILISGSDSLAYVGYSKFDALHAGLVKLVSKHTPKREFPPNPHPSGTYLWAREEHKRMHYSSSLCLRRGSWDAARVVRGGHDWSGISFWHADFIATDWEVVP